MHQNRSVSVTRCCTIKNAGSHSRVHSMTHMPFIPSTLWARSRHVWPFRLDDELLLALLGIRTNRLAYRPSRGRGKTEIVNRARQETPYQPKVGAKTSTGAPANRLQFATEQSLISIQAHIATGSNRFESIAFLLLVKRWLNVWMGPPSFRLSNWNLTHKKTSRSFVWSNC